MRVRGRGLRIRILDWCKSWFTVNSEAHNLAKFAAQPGFCIQQAYNHADSGPVAEAAGTWIDKMPGTPMLLLSPASLPGFNPHPACLRSLEGHSGGVVTVALTPDGRLAISGSRDRTLRVWEVESGRCLAVSAVSALTTVMRIKGMQMILGDLNGNVYFSQLHHVEEGTPFVTASRLSLIVH
jgi:WD40 repeat protein